MISVSLSDEEFKQFEMIAQKKGTSVSELLREMVLERIEQEQILIAYEEAIHAYRRNPFSFSLDEVEKELASK